MKFLGAWVSAIALFAVPAFAGQNIIRNYNTARDKFFYKKLYPHGGWTIYCGKRWRTKRGLNVEHVYPASWMAKHLGCGARRQCRTDSQRFNFMEADLHNLYPSLARINQARSNYPAFPIWIISFVGPNAVFSCKIKVLASPCHHLARGPNG